MPSTATAPRGGVHVAGARGEQTDSPVEPQSLNGRGRNRLTVYFRARPTHVTYNDTEQTSSEAGRAMANPVDLEGKGHCVREGSFRRTAGDVLFNIF